MILIRRFLPCLILLTTLIVPVRGQLTTEQLDAALEAAWAERGIEPAPAADDAAFLRRVSLDVRGVVPSLEETIAFLKDDRPDQRARVIEDYLQSPKRGAHWAAYWDKVLVGMLEQPANPVAQLRIKEGWREWMASAINSGRPWDEVVHDIITARGDLREEPEILPLARWNNMPESMAGSVSRAFLGKQIQCAQCHDHKEDPALTQKKFWEFAAFFSGTTQRPVRSEMGGFESLMLMDRPARWQQPIPEVEPAVNVRPRYLDGSPAVQQIVDSDGDAMSRSEIRETRRHLMELNRERRRMQQEGAAPQDMLALVERMPDMHDTRRNQLAVMMFREDDMQIARNTMNRLWARYFGRGFLEPVDAWGNGVEPVMPEVLELLAREFIAGGWDLRQMERLILNSRAYQLSPMPTETSAPYPDLFAHALVRPLGPNQLLDSLLLATQSDPTQRAFNERRRQNLRDRYISQFVFTFGNDEMEWQNTFEASIPRALFLLNDSGINEIVQADSDSMTARILNQTDDPQAMTRYLYLAALSREPEPVEADAMEMLLAEAPDRRAAVEDAFWALLNSAEFVTNH